MSSKVMPRSAATTCRKARRCAWTRRSCSYRWTHQKPRRSPSSGSDSEMTTSQTPPFHFFAGNPPLLISTPHVGPALPRGGGGGWSEAAPPLPDPAGHLPRLYDFAGKLGAGVLGARYSRFVIDL